MATHACKEGGTIVLLAECRDGLGRPDFLKWFDEQDSYALAARLRDAYEVNGQTAWSLLTKTETYRIHLVSNLPDDSVRRMRMTPAPTLAKALQRLNKQEQGYILPRGTALLPRVSD
jgi:nickel-dependent lactate racemase